MYDRDVTYHTPFIIYPLNGGKRAGANCTFQLYVHFYVFIALSARREELRFRKRAFLSRISPRVSGCRGTVIRFWVHTYRGDPIRPYRRVADAAGSTSWRRIRDGERRTGSDGEEEAARERRRSIPRDLERPVPRMLDGVAKLFRFSVEERECRIESEPNSSRPNANVFRTRFSSGILFSATFT